MNGSFDRLRSYSIILLNDMTMSSTPNPKRALYAQLSNWLNYAVYNYRFPPH